MPFTIDTEQSFSHASNCGPFDYMEIIIIPDENVGGVVFGRGREEANYDKDEIPPEKWEQIVQLDREMVAVMNGYINRALEILRDVPCQHPFLQLYGELNFQASEETVGRVGKV